MSAAPKRITVMLDPADYERVEKAARLAECTVEEFTVRSSWTVH